MADHRLPDGRIIEIAHTHDRNGNPVIGVTVLNDELLPIAGPVDLRSAECTPERIRGIIPDGESISAALIVDLLRDCRRGKETT